MTGPEPPGDTQVKSAVVALAAKRRHNPSNMRGLGAFQRNQRKNVDPRLGRLFTHLREVLDIIEDIVTRPYEKAEPPPAPEAVKAKPSPPTNGHRPAAMTINDAARTTGLSRNTIYKLMSEGKLPKVKIGSRTLIRMTDIDALLNPAAPP